MKSPVAKRSVVINGHKTSVSLETAFWDAMKEIAEIKGMIVSQLIAEIDQAREQHNLSSALRLFVLRYYRERVPMEQRLAQFTTKQDGG
jgi:predicted DNA-binding ribbon-helix-helix protein